MMTDNAKTGSKSSTKAKASKRVADKKAEAKAPEAPVETTETPAAEEPAEATAPAKAEEPAQASRPHEPRFSADDWYKASKRQLGVPAWITRAALAGQPEDRVYSRSEIDKLVQAALSSPA